MEPILTMNDRTRIVRTPQRARPPAARTAAAVIAIAVLSLLAAACGGGTSSNRASGSPDAGGSANSPAGRSTNSPSAVAYSQCIRSHGVPSYPDPGSDGQIPKGSGQRFGVSDSQLHAAQSACQHLLPNATSFQQQTQQCMLAGDCPQALVQQILTRERHFAQCMRSHGVPNWPDPSLDSEGRPIFNLIPAGITHTQTHSPPLTTKMAECERLDPSPVPMMSN